MEAGDSRQEEAHCMQAVGLRKLAVRRDSLAAHTFFSKI